MYAQERDAQMGALPVAAVAAAAGAIKGVGSVISNIFGSGRKKKDAARIAKTEEAYNAAMSGDTKALEFLKYRTGKFGISKPINLGYWTENKTVAVGGWATDKTKQYANQRYQQVLAAYQAAGRPTTTVTAKQGAPTQASMTPMLLAAGAVAVAVALTNRRK